MIKVGNNYKLFNAKMYTSKKGFPYIRGRISDSTKQEDGTWKATQWYQVMIFRNAEEIFEKGYFKLTKISSIEKQVNDYNGKRYENFTLCIDGELPNAQQGGGYTQAGTAEHGVYDHEQPSIKNDDYSPIPDDGDLPF